MIQPSPYTSFQVPTSLQHLPTQPTNNTTILHPTLTTAFHTKRSKHPQNMPMDILFNMLVSGMADLPTNTQPKLIRNPIVSFFSHISVPSSFLYPFGFTHKKLRCVLSVYCFHFFIILYVIQGRIQRF